MTLRSFLLFQRWGCSGGYVLLSGKFLGLEEDGSPMRWARVGELIEIDTCLLNGVKENLKKKKRELQRKKRKLNKQKKRKKTA